MTLKSAQESFVQDSIVPKKKILVVKELPMQPIRQLKEEDGSIVDLITVEEYLTEMANAGSK